MIKTIPAFAACLLIAGCSSGLEEKARERLSATLKDPSTAEFRNLIKGKPGDDGVYLICGEFNAKNSFGAYNGFKRFVVSSEGESEPIIENSEASTAIFDGMGSGICN